MVSERAVVLSFLASAGNLVFCYLFGFFFARVKSGEEVSVIEERVFGGKMSRTGLEFSSDLK